MTATDPIDGAAAPIPTREELAALSARLEAALGPALGARAAIVAPLWGEARARLEALVPASGPCALPLARQEEILGELAALLDRIEDLAEALALAARAAPRTDDEDGR